MSTQNAYLRNAEQYAGSHKFLAEELLMPNANRTDLARTNMFSSHLTQAVVLDEPERPRVFSRFENKIGSYTTAVRRAKANAVVIGTFEQSPLQTAYAMEYEGGIAAIHIAKPVRHLTETYGYRLDNGPMQGVTEGSVLAAEDVMQGWPCNDSDGNFMYGTNLKTVYMNLDGLTYEDGLVISAGAAERMAHTSIETVTVNLNANDLTLNLYGEVESDYQGFPEVGEPIKNGVLLARRRVNHESILFDLSTPQLTRINYDGDTVFYSEGSVVGIEIFSNLSEVELERHPFNRQLLAHHRDWLRFQAWVIETFWPYVEAEGARVGVNYTEDVAFWYKYCRDTQGSKWRHERSEFDGVVLRFTVARRNPVQVGSKLTNRYGGKGVVSQIRADEEMPTTVEGVRADLVVNSLGVVNRLNPSQLFESELNFIADHVAAEIRRCVRGDIWPKAWCHLLTFLSIASPEQAEWTKAALDTDEKVEAFVTEIADGEPIYIHQAPYFGNIPLEGLKDLYDHFGVERVAFAGIEERMILGTNYYLKLRHEPDGKHSARSAKHLSVAGVPAKNARGVRTGTEHHSTTPIRLGEQEMQGLLAANNPDELKRMLRIYATDDVSREGVIEDLVLRKDPFTQARLEPRGSGVTRPVAGLTALMESIGQRLVFEDSDEQQQEESKDVEDTGTEQQ